MNIQGQMDMLIDKLEKLENENKELKAKLETRLTCDFVKIAQIHAVQDFAEKLKAKIEEKGRYYICIYDWGGHSVRMDCTNAIDKLVKEYENGKQI